MKTFYFEGGAEVLKKEGEYAILTGKDNGCYSCVLKNI